MPNLRSWPLNLISLKVSATCNTFCATSHIKMFLSLIRINKTISFRASLVTRSLMVVTMIVLNIAYCLEHSHTKYFTVKIYKIFFVQKLRSIKVSRFWPQKSYIMYQVAIWINISEFLENNPCISTFIKNFQTKYNS